MKAVVCTQYGSPDVLQMEEVAKPTPKESEILIKNYATTLHIGDSKLRRMAPGLGPIKDIFFKPIMRCIIGFKGPRKPILGMELAGVVEAVGREVTKFKVGDRVFASTGFRFGAHAEYTTLPENGVIALLPESLSYEEAAPVPNGAITAYRILKKAKIQKGDRVLIYGASGSVGTFAVQLAKEFGAEVTGVCSTGNMEMVSSLGADLVIDYTKEDFANTDSFYDIVFDAVGKAGSARCRSVLKRSGAYMNVLTSSDGITMKQEDLQFIATLLAEGKIGAIIDRTYTLDEIKEAHRYVDLGHKKGNVVIKVQ